MALPRRTLLAAGLGAAATSLVGCGPDPSSPGGPAPTTAPSQSPSPSTRPLPAATTEKLTEKLTQTLTRYLAPTPDNPKHPTYAGAVALVLRDGAVAASIAVGDAVRYRAGPVELPAGQRVKVREGSIFDLASVTKVYTAILLLRLVDQGRVDLAAPVARYLPAFGGGTRSTVTVAQLLAHTSGLPVGAKVTGLPNAAARRAAVLATPLLPGAVPGSTFRYSSVGLMLAADLVEMVGGRPLDQSLRTELTEPLGLRDTGFRPLTWTTVDRLVATDARSSRGLLRGVVHDEVANILGGIAGHAGIFSTAADLGVIGQLLLDGGSYQGRRILSAELVTRMLVNANPGLPAVDPDRPGRSADHGFGVELNQRWFMGAMAGPRTFGHTGFTGTSLLVDAGRRLVLVILSNRAHPNWSWSNPDPMRAAVADVVASELR